MRATESLQLRSPIWKTPPDRDSLIRSITTVLLNMVDSTVGVIPITRVIAELDRHPPDFLAGSTGSKILEERVYKGPKAAYNADEMDGLPVGVQVIGKAWEEEKVLGMMKVLEDLVGYA
jgi:hypothetical protein